MYLTIRSEESPKPSSSAPAGHESAFDKYHVGYILAGVVILAAVGGGFWFWRKNQARFRAQQASRDAGATKENYGGQEEGVETRR